MKTRLGIAAGIWLCSSVAFAELVDTTGPDFVGASPPRHVDRDLVASPDGAKRIEPVGVVQFQRDRAQLTNTELVEVDTAVRWMKSNPKHLLVLEGHTDASGSAMYNEDLAARRVATVCDHMVRQGIAADRIMMITFGEREARNLANPLSGADRRVVMYATQLSPQAVAAAVRTNRPVLSAAWVQPKR
jgi:outer membrane protein OmpA-like peptidoglycan-associated protein